MRRANTRRAPRNALSLRRHLAHGKPPIHLCHPPPFRIETFATPLEEIARAKPRDRMQASAPAFAAPALPVVSAGGFASAHGAVCGVSAPAAAVAPAVTMRCRRDLKKEKSQRNLEYARLHRKRAPSRFNRRNEAQDLANVDQAYLTDLFGTLTFDAAPQEDTRGGGGGGRGRR